jgi:hypothetical protein
MKAILPIPFLLALLLAACAHQQRASPSRPVGGRAIVSGADAIAVVLADIQRRGGDPRREECSAHPTDEGWWVTAWHIFHPHHKGDRRFVPGGFTDYIVSRDGRILKTLPGS